MISNEWGKPISESTSSSDISFTHIITIQTISSFNANHNNTRTTLYMCHCNARIHLLYLCTLTFYSVYEEKHKLNLTTSYQRKMVRCTTTSSLLRHQKRQYPTPPNNYVTWYGLGYSAFNMGEVVACRQKAILLPQNNPKRRETGFAHIFIYMNTHGFDSKRRNRV